MHAYGQTKCKYGQTSEISKKKKLIPYELANKEGKLTIVVQCFTQSLILSLYAVFPRTVQQLV